MTEYKEATVSNSSYIPLRNKNIMIKAQEITFVSNSQNKVFSKPESMQVLNRLPSSIVKESAVGVQSFVG